MSSRDQGSKVLNLLKGKFMLLFRLINKIRSLEEFVIYISMAKGKFVPLLRDVDKEIEEAELRQQLKDYPYFSDKTKGDFKIIVAYGGDESYPAENMDEIEEICLELIELVLEEATEVQKRVLEENKMLELIEKSQLDRLTGLYNRDTFDILYGDIYDKSKLEDRDFSVLMIDLDNFKQVNDSYGHQMGDKVLKKVSEKIKLNVRRNDIVARYGGEEIIIILVDIDEAEAVVIAERIRDSIATLRTEGVGVTISIGISNLKKDYSIDGDMLIYIADKRLYEAKGLGKNKVRGKKKEK